MSHFAEIDKKGMVVRVIVAVQDFIDSGAVGDSSHWLQTSYNTRSGKHLQGGTPFRGNFAGVGFIYDAKRDAFLPPQPFPSWVINNTTFNWDAPIPYPSDGLGYQWDEVKGAWILAVPAV